MQVFALITHPVDSNPSPLAADARANNGAIHLWPLPIHIRELLWCRRLSIPFPDSLYRCRSKPFGFMGETGLRYLEWAVGYSTRGTKLSERDDRYEDKPSRRRDHPSNGRSVSLSSSRRLYLIDHLYSFHNSASSCSDSGIGFRHCTCSAPSTNLATTLVPIRLLQSCPRPDSTS